MRGSPMGSQTEELSRSCEVSQEGPSGAAGIAGFVGEPPGRREHKCIGRAMRAFAWYLALPACLLLSAGLRAYALRARGVKLTNKKELHEDKLLKLVHYLNLSPGFVEECEREAARDDGARVIDLATYLSSIEFQSKVTLFSLAASWLVHKKKWIPLMFLGFLPQKGQLFGEAADALQSFDALVDFIGQSSMGTVGDWFHHFKSRVDMGVSNTRILLGAKGFAKRAPSSNLVSATTETLSIGSGLADPFELERDLELEVEKRVLARNLVEPDKIHYVQPEPVLPEVFPDLCVGFGGLTPLQTPRGSIRNTVVAEILNRLAANYLREPSELFVVTVQGEKVVDPERFFELVDGLEVHFSRNSSSFGAMLCVRDDATQYASYDLKAKLAYRQIPLVWPCRFSVRDPDSGEKIRLPSQHASLVLSSGTSTLIKAFRVQYFLGPDGLTNWKSGDDYLRPWAKFISSPVPTKAQEAQLMGFAAALSVLSANGATQLGLFKGGYSYFGGCCDSVAALQLALNDKVEAFPVLCSGDAWLSVSKAATRLETNDERFRARMDRLAEVVPRLPNDNVVHPSDAAATMERAKQCLMGPFELVQATLNDWQRLQTGWEHQ